ncbi:anthrone oxygenase family protein [Hoeflea sp. AS60]|uniref:anthrone oxygenase family protein n=1 Tax=Hoeflea sp. AS60 TaxID=3135780 RepID=UPI00316F0855
MKATIMSLWFILLCAASVIAYAAIGGVFLAFSDFIMRSFNLVSAQGGIESMQVINVEIMRSVFMVLFMGLTLVSLIITVYAAVNVDGTPKPLLMLAGGLYLVGVFAVTAAGNVPLNNQLAAIDRASPQSLAFWKQTYMTSWVTLNSLRTLACLLASGLTLAALAIR